MFHHAYEYDILVNPGMVINATEGGAKINGTESFIATRCHLISLHPPIFDLRFGMTRAEVYRVKT